MRRPLLTLLGVFLLGEMFGSWVEKSIWIAVGSAVALAGILWRSNKQIAEKNTRYCILLLLLFALGFAWNYGVAQHELAKEEPLAQAAGEMSENKADEGGEPKERGGLIPEGRSTIHLSGIVTDIRAGGCTLDSNCGKVLVWLKEDAGQITEPALKVGDRITISGTPERISDGTNPGAFDSKEYYEGEGIHWQLSADRVKELVPGDDWVGTFLGSIRSGCIERIESILPEKEAGVLSAMLLGERSGMDQELKELYRRNGIAHILAISGLHVSLIATALLALLLKLGLSKRRASIVTILFLFFYGLLTGFAPATLRAIWMLTAVNLSGVFLRTADVPTSAGVALFLILLFQPYRAASTGMLMSFLSVIGIVSEGELFRGIFGRERFLRVPTRLRSPFKRLVGMLMFGLSLQVFLQPVIYRDSYSITPYSPFVNLLVVPLLSVAVMSGVLGMLLTLVPWFLPVARVIVLPCKWILQLYEWLCRLVLRVPGHEIVTGHISTEEMVCMVVIAFLLIYLFVMRLKGRRDQRKKWRYYFLALGMMVLWLAATTGYTMLRNRLTGSVTFLDVGQGDGCLVHTASGADLLFDCGSTSKNEVGENILIPALRYYGVTELDAVFVSHTDEDHMNGILELLEKREEYGISVRTLVFGAGTLSDEKMERLKEAAGQKKEQEETGMQEAGKEDVGQDETGQKKEQEETGMQEAGKGDVGQDETGQETGGEKVEILFLSAGEELCTGDATVTILLPEKGTEGSGNEFSMVQLLTLPDCRILFTGDIGWDQEQQLAEKIKTSGEKLRPDILKVAHHGSAYSSDMQFLREIGGGMAVISCGKRNRYGHPAKETLERLKDAGFTVWRTDRQGAVVLELP